MRRARRTGGIRARRKNSIGPFECSALPPTLIRSTKGVRRLHAESVLSQMQITCKRVNMSVLAALADYRLHVNTSWCYSVFFFFSSSSPPPPTPTPNPQAVAHHVPYANIGKDRLWWASHRNSSSSPTVFHIFQPLSPPFYIWPPSPFPLWGSTHYFPLSPRSLRRARACERVWCMYIYRSDKWGHFIPC